MGMIDEIRIKWKLPWPEAQNLIWQSKDTPAQFLDLYEVREDGTFWHQAYDPRWEENPDSSMGFTMHRDNEQWERVEVDGEIEVYKCVEHPGGFWYSVRFWFRDGAVKDVIYRKPEITE